MTETSQKSTTVNGIPRCLIRGLMHQTDFTFEFDLPTWFCRDILNEIHFC